MRHNSESGREPEQAILRFMAQEFCIFCWCRGNAPTSLFFKVVSGDSQGLMMWSETFESGEFCAVARYRGGIPGVHPTSALYFKCETELA